MATREQVLALRSEAAEAGDRAQVALCDTALAGSVTGGETWREAWQACETAIEDAQAQREDYTARPVVVGDVWEGVLEFRTVRVVSVNEVEVVSRDMNSRGWFEHFGLAEFRERFTRRGR